VLSNSLDSDIYTVSNKKGCFLKTTFVLYFLLSSWGYKTRDPGTYPPPPLPILLAVEPRNPALDIDTTEEIRQDKLEIYIRLPRQEPANMGGNTPVSCLYM
jgi:hypothetical protein